MTFNRGYRRAGVARLISILLVIWLVIGAIAAAQRHYFTSAAPTCAGVSTVIVTILAGPLNYAGTNPKVHCSTPQPSK